MSDVGEFGVIDRITAGERQQTEAIINDLAAIGIRANLRFVQYATQRELIKGNKVGLTHQTWGSFSVNDVSAGTPVWFGCIGEDITQDREVCDLLKKGDTTVDPNARKATYQEALKIIADKAYAVPLWSLPTYYVASADLVFKPYPDEMPRFWEMSWR